MTDEQPTDTLTSAFLLFSALCAATLLVAIIGQEISQSQGWGR